MMMMIINNNDDISLKTTIQTDLMGASATLQGDARCDGAKKWSCCIRSVVVVSQMRSPLASVDPMLARLDLCNRAHMTTEKSHTRSHMLPLCFFVLARTKSALLCRRSIASRKRSLHLWTHLLVC